MSRVLILLEYLFIRKVCRIVGVLCLFINWYENGLVFGLER